MKIPPLTIANCGYGTAAQASALLLRAHQHVANLERIAAGLLRGL